MHCVSSSVYVYIWSYFSSTTDKYSLLTIIIRQGHCFPLSIEVCLLKEISRYIHREYPAHMQIVDSLDM